MTAGSATATLVPCCSAGGAAPAKTAGPPDSAFAHATHAAMKNKHKSEHTNIFQTFSDVALIMLTALLRTIWTWDKFDIIYQLTGGGPLQTTTTMSIYVYYEMFEQFNQGRAAAVAMVMFLIMLTMSLIYTALYDRAERAQS